MPCLKGTVGGRALNLPLESRRLLIGRGPQNGLDLLDRSVSRRHAELLVDEGGLRLQDLGSSNGTWVNGRRITESVELRPGDRLRFGTVELVLGNGEETEFGAGPDALREESIASLVVSEHISAQESLSWDEARSEFVSGSRLSQMLLRAVTEAGQVLVLPRPLNETFDLVLSVVERVIPVRRILLLLTDGTDGSPVIRAARPAGRSTSEQLILSHTILATVLHDRQAMLLNDVLSDPRFSAQESVIAQNLRSAMVAPLFDNQQVIGLLYADNDAPHVHYDRDQLRAFTLLANLIAVKITNARLLESERETERLEQEVAAAAHVQQTLLNGRLPGIAGYEVAAHHLPCQEVGGDLYDVTRLDDGRIALVVGDVSGKGMAAALLMSNVLAGLRVLYPENPGAAAVAERLDRELLRSSDETHFVTLFLGLLDPRTHALEYVNAGHNAPLLFVAGKEPRQLAATGIPLGMMAGARYEIGHAEMPPGALLCAFSDGIPEAQRDEEFYGDERFRASVRCRHDCPLEEIVSGALDDLASFMGEQRFGDDVTLLLLRRSAQG